MRRALALAAALTAALLGATATACTRREAQAEPLPSARAAAVAVAPPTPAPAKAAPDTTTSADAGPSATTPAVPRFVGRWMAEPHDRRAPDAGSDGMRCGWSGCYVTVRFSGPSVSARLRDEGSNLFEVVVDGEARRVLRTDKARGEALYVLAEGLSSGEHEVSLHRRTEAKLGEIVFYAFEPAQGGRLLPPSPAPTRRMETIGDSISAGYGNEGPNATCTFVNSQENEYATYAAIAARSLGADHTTIAWSGKSIREMRGYFDEALPQRTDGPPWDFSRYQPDVVVVNVGTNDFANVDPGEARFVRAYVDLMQAVRAAYPKAFVVSALGPMLNDTYPEGRRALTKARRYTRAALAKLRDAGESNLAYLEFPEQDHADGLGCGFHPSLKTHRLMSDRLTTFLKERMGW